MQRLILQQTISAFVAFVALIGAIDPARCQVDTSSYPRSYPAPSALDTIGKVQQLEMQRQQIEIQKLQMEQQRLQIEQQRLQFQEQLQGSELQCQLEFEQQQAELYRKRQMERAKAKGKNQSK